MSKRIFVTETYVQVPTSSMARMLYNWKIKVWCTPHQASWYCLFSLIWPCAENGLTIISLILILTHSIDILPQSSTITSLSTWTVIRPCRTCVSLWAYFMLHGTSYRRRSPLKALIIITNARVLNVVFEVCVSVETVCWVHCIFRKICKDGVFV